ncbi:MAG: hypothetical protein OEY43_04215 [Gammaproteobacteria bacterium]|nr:hypothetical protein [Gammaproteobacteria bacterium]
MTDTKNLDPSIQLHVSTSELDGFCQKLIKRSRDTSKTHESLITLETFIALFSATSKGSDEYYAVESLIKSHTEITRQQLLDEKTIELAHALLHQDINKLTAVHTPLSRNGFHNILSQICQQLTAGEVIQACNWCTDWLTMAKQKAEEASGYPDAMDFKKAGIAFEEYQAMLDTGRVLSAL